MTYSDICHRIATVYDAGEARAIARYLVEEQCAMSYADILCGGVEHLPVDVVARLDASVRRIEAGEPLQHVLGYAYFCGNRFTVDGSVLIPRPETEWLVERVASLLSTDNPTAQRVLDIGTGSGCIAISLKLRLATAYVEAWDISDAALATARHNATTLGADVVFHQCDALTAADDVATADTQSAADSKWHCIVSNPPYICDSERADMADNVLRHEPHTALFVPDADPLRFYRAIARYAKQTLATNGVLLFECNTRYAEATAAMLREMGFERVSVSNDCFGKERFVEGYLGSSADETKYYLKLSALCARSEHSSGEMLDKMRRWNLDDDACQRVLQRLISERFVDDERFARLFVRDKIRFDRWGRRKIEQALYRKGVDTDISRRVLDEVDDADYVAELRKLIATKRRSLKANSDYELNMKLTRYAMQRGFDYRIIKQCINCDIDEEF